MLKHGDWARLLTSFSCLRNHSDCLALCIGVFCKGGKSVCGKRACEMGLCFIVIIKEYKASKPNNSLYNTWQNVLWVKCSCWFYSTVITSWCIKEGEFYITPPGYFSCLGYKWLRSSWQRCWFNAVVIAVANLLVEVCFCQQASICNMFCL